MLVFEVAVGGNLNVWLVQLRRHATRNLMWSLKKIDVEVIQPKPSVYLEKNRSNWEIIAGGFNPLIT
jgi:hypothetical protein